MTRQEREALFDKFDRITDAEALKTGDLTSAEKHVDEAILKLRTARNLLVKAGAERTAARVRLAISSAAGAKRNARARVRLALSGING